MLCSSPSADMLLLLFLKNGQIDNTAHGRCYIAFNWTRATNEHKYMLS